jgi:hypothetical protein
MLPPWRRTVAFPALLLAACASTPPPPPEPPAWSAEREAQAEALSAKLRRAPADAQLVVRLAFPADVDLDLYVTDPRLETVYYANTPSVSGGRLEEDRRCEAAAEGGIRVETVRFEAPPPGRYRIGVDFPHVCEGGPEATPYAVSIEASGDRSELTGMARWLEFEPIVREFDVP